VAAVTCPRCSGALLPLPGLRPESVRLVCIECRTIFSRIGPELIPVGVYAYNLKRRDVKDKRAEPVKMKPKPKALRRRA